MKPYIYFCPIFKKLLPFQHQLYDVITEQKLPKSELPLPYTSISLNCPPPRDQCFTYGANAVFLSSRSPSLGPDVAFIEAFPYLASSPVSRLKFTCKKGLNPVDTAQQHQFRAPLYRPIVQIQVYYIPFPTNITGNLDHSNLDLYYWYRYCMG